MVILSRWRKFFNLITFPRREDLTTASEDPTTSSNSIYIRGSLSNSGRGSERFDNYVRFQRYDKGEDNLEYPPRIGNYVRAEAGLASEAKNNYVRADRIRDNNYMRLHYPSSSDYVRWQNTYIPSFTRNTCQEWDLRFAFCYEVSAGINLWYD